MSEFQTISESELQSIEGGLLPFVVPFCVGYAIGIGLGLAGATALGV